MPRAPVVVYTNFVIYVFLSYKQNKKGTKMQGDIITILMSFIFDLFHGYFYTYLSSCFITMLQCYLYYILQQVLYNPLKTIIYRRKKTKINKQAGTIWFLSNVNMFSTM